MTGVVDRRGRGGAETCAVQYGHSGQRATSSGGCNGAPITVDWMADRARYHRKHRRNGWGREAHHRFPDKGLAADAGGRRHCALWVWRESCQIVRSRFQTWRPLVVHARLIAMVITESEAHVIEFMRGTLEAGWDITFRKYYKSTTAMIKIHARVRVCVPKVSSYVPRVHVCRRSPRNAAAASSAVRIAACCRRH